MEAYQDPSTMSRSESSNSSREPRLRPKSRGSTTSLQSLNVGSGFQAQQQQNIPDPNNPYMQHGQSQMQAVYNQTHPNDAMIQYHQQITQIQQPHQILEHNVGYPPHHDIRPMSQQGFHHEPQHFNMQYPNALSQYPLPNSHVHHMRHHSEQYEGSPAPEDSNNENSGAKRRKGAASSMANDAELKRLLEQHGSKSLKEIAMEVQKNEGSGGKSEKAKQVFAMLWLRENCQKSTNSVRRDRVFARYTERCGNERVPTLNPASFGKLVRIIFPNVQTRRLGVRGESKYHYVDLSLIDTEEQQQPLLERRPSTAGSIAPQRPDSSATLNKPFSQNDGSIDASQGPISIGMELADFPAPSSTFQLRPQAREIDHSHTQDITKMDCRYLNTATIRIPTANMSINLINHLPAVRSNLPATMATYLAMPSQSSLSSSETSAQDTPIELPDIHDYLTGTKYDAHIAKLLQDLYRSYCIDVIDAFRKCKDKNFFSHHSAFNGKMTVPVSKVFNLECVAPWIEECDMRMYKQIVRFLAPLAQQEVPDTVWRCFSRISTRLVSHLVAAFEEKCPVHVVAAKVVPAARFTTLLKKLHGANAAALKVNHLLAHDEHRTQMWLDLMVYLDPEGILDDSNPPPESLGTIRGVLKHDVRALLDPKDDMKHLVEQAETDPDSIYAVFLSQALPFPGVLPAEDGQNGLLHRWIEWLEQLPTAFEGHHPQCMLDWHSRFWRIITNQLLTNDAISYTAWLGLESFATQMLAYMTQMEGFLLDGDQQKGLDKKEQEKSKQDVDLQKQRSSKRKRDEEDNEGNARSRSRRNTADDHTAHAESLPQFLSPNMDHATVGDDSDAEMDELRRGGPLDLPLFRTGLSSPVKAGQDHHLQHPNPMIDDSGIGLGLDDHDDADNLAAEPENKKFNRRDWFLSSDPVEPGMASLGVIA